ncbi:MAG: hypothetical protein ACFFEY_18160 [Candidatus Thorarchaeota archaeon]
MTEREVVEQLQTLKGFLILSLGLLTRLLVKGEEKIQHRKKVCYILIQTSLFIPFVINPCVCLI